MSQNSEHAKPVLESDSASRSLSSPEAVFVGSVLGLPPVRDRSVLARALGDVLGVAEEVPAQKKEL